MPCSLEDLGTTSWVESLRLGLGFADELKAGGPFGLERVSALFTNLMSVMRETLSPLGGDGLFGGVAWGWHSQNPKASSRIPQSQVIEGPIP